MSDVPASILVFRNGSIGNTLAAVPALRALHSRYPHVPLNVVVDTIGEDLLHHCPWIHHLIVYDKRGRDRGLIAYLRLIHRLRGFHPSHAVLFKRFFRNGLLALLSGARIRAGFITDGNAPFLNYKIPYDETVSIVDLNLRLAAALGAKSTNQRLEMFLSAEDIASAQEIVHRHIGDSNPYFVAHYGGKKNAPGFFSPGRFIQLFHPLTAGKMPIFFICFGAHETTWAEGICAAMPKAINACNLPLRTTAAILQNAKGFLGFNSGPAHIAAAVVLPELVLFQPDERTAAEITKWLPPSDLTRALVPPVSPQESAWSAFISAAEQSYNDLIRLSPHRRHDG
jgi:ADP-heptose:LPS heptosyltransferase